MTRRAAIYPVVAIVLAAAPSGVAAQDTADVVAPDTGRPPPPAATWLGGNRRSRLYFGSGKTYNRVEGLPVRIGPIFTDSVRRAQIAIEALGVLRSGDDFRWDGANVGHDVRASIRTIGARGIALTAAAYDIVGAMEEWQLPRGEAGIAAFLFHRDYRDHFGRHGASAELTVFAGVRTRFTVGLADERWISRDVRQVLTVWRNNHSWRANPSADEGHARLFTTRAELDTRNDARNPWSGWHTVLEYERGSGTVERQALMSPVARFGPPSRLRYGRILVDARSYNRISPETQLNLRFVAGGWIHGGELPLQRRLSVGGPATVPGVDFREFALGPDVGTCSDGVPPPGVPAQCERVLLFQAEYRDDLPIRPGTIFGGTPIRIRSAALTLRPTLVAFVDAGRGWLLTPRAGTAPATIPRDLVYGTGRIPPLGTFRTDVGLGVDLGLLGVYVAKSVSEPKEPANVFVRARARF